MIVSLIRTFFTGVHAGTLIEYYNTNTEQVTAWQQMEAGTPRDYPKVQGGLVSVVEAIADQWIGTQTATNGVPLSVLFSGGGGSTFPSKDLPGVGETNRSGTQGPDIGQSTAAAGAQIWKKIIQAAGTVDNSNIPYFLLADSCQTLVAYLDYNGGIPSILPTDAKFNMMSAPGFYLPLGGNLLFYKNPVTEAAYTAAALSFANTEYQKDNALHWQTDGWLYNAIEDGITPGYRSQYDLSGPDNTVPIFGASGGYLGTALLELFLSQLNSHSNSPAASDSSAVLSSSNSSLAGLPTAQLQYALTAQISYLQNLAATEAGYEDLSPGNTTIAQDVLSPLNSSAGAEALGAVNILLQQQGTSQLSIVLGPPAGGGTLDGTTGNELLVGFSGNNTLIAGGNDELYAGLGANTYQFGTAALSAAQSGAPSIVLDYDQSNNINPDNLEPTTPAFSASEGDKIDVSAIVGTAYDGGAGKPVGSLVRAVEDSSDKFADLEVNNTGTGSWVTIAELYGLSLNDPISVVLDGALSPSTIAVQSGGASGGGPVVTALSTSTTGEASTGQSVVVRLTMSEGGLTLASGTSTSAVYLGLNDGTYLTYDSGASNLSTGTLVFDDPSGSGISTPDVEVNYIYAGGYYGTFKDSGGNLASFSAAVNAYTGLQIGPASVTAVTPSNYGILSEDGVLTTGQSITLTVSMSEGVIVNNTGGSPKLTLNDGGIAAYDANLSNPATGTLVFDYTVGAADYTTQLAVTGLNPNGATIEDANGVTPNFANAAQTIDFGELSSTVGGTSVEVNADIVTVLAASQTGEIDLGQTVQLTLTMSGAVTLNSGGGLPTLSLSDGATATYDANASSPANRNLVFDYTVGASDATPTLYVSAVNLPSGTTVVDANGNNVDFSGALSAPVGLQVGPAFVEVVSTNQASTVETGQQVVITVTMSDLVTVNDSGGSPTLSLSDGGTATYDAANSDPSTGSLLFDYTVGAQDQTADLLVNNVVLPTGTTIKDTSGLNANLTAAENVDTGLTVNSPLTVTSVSTSQQGNITSGQTITIYLTMSESAIVGTLNGTPALSLNDGGTATYASNSSGKLGFSYKVAPSNSTSNLEVVAVNLDGGAISTVNGYAADFSGAIGVPTGTSVTATVPVLANVPAAAAYTAGASVVELAPSLTLSDVSSGTLTAAAVSISGGYVGDGDVLSADTTGTGITASYDAADEILLLTGDDTLADYQAVLKSVTFSATSQDPTEGGADPTRTVTWEVNDGSNLSTAQTTTLNISASTSASPVWDHIDNGSPLIDDGGQFPEHRRGQMAASFAGYGTYLCVNGPGWTKIDNGVPALMTGGDFAGLGHPQLAGVFAGYGTYTYTRSRLEQDRQRHAGAADIRRLSWARPCSARRRVRRLRHLYLVEQHRLDQDRQRQSHAAHVGRFPWLKRRQQ